MFLLNCIAMADGMVLWDQSMKYQSNLSSCSSMNFLIRTAHSVSIQYLLYIDVLVLLIKSYLTFESVVRID